MASRERLMERFTVKRLHGVTEIKLRDDTALREEFCREMAQYAPLLSEMSGAEPTFDSLKRTKQAAAFLSGEEAAGRPVMTVLRVCGVKGVVTEKEVQFFHEDGGFAASSRWRIDSGITFARPS